jgi:zinc metalloprotease ZmpB
MAFEITPNVTVEYDDAGVARHIEHLTEPYTSEQELKPRDLAAEYVSAVGEEYGLKPQTLTGLDEFAPGTVVDQGPALSFAHEKSLMGTTLVSYQQTYLGLPVWEAGVSVVLQDNPSRVTSSHSTLHTDVHATAPLDDAPYLPERIEPENLGQLLGLGHVADLTINRKRPLIYQYDPLQRFDPETLLPHADEGAELHTQPPTLPLPPVPDSIEAGRHYVVAEVLFTVTPPNWPEPVNWRSFIEPETGAVLYLRAFLASVAGDVYLRDPLTKTGDATITPASPAGTLDPLRDSVTLDGLTAPAPGAQQALSGEFVQLLDITAPAVAPPTSAGNFVFSVPTDDFAAVNAYHHCDSTFRMVASMGFSIPGYFDGTTFPVRVDHRATIGNNCPLGNCVNAQAPGNATGNGSDGFRFALEAANQPVGIACDYRVVLHEFGHVLLWDSVHSPNFGFAHSCGDSLAAIINDPGSQAPDRGRTFPWTIIDRRHDRPVATWAWGGPNDLNGYASEQILSTTMFRFYRSIGGDSTDINMRQLASRYSVYLIVRAVGTLATSPVTPTPNATVFATAVQTADIGTTSFEGQPGGAYAKVLRWAFEKQGLYQPVGAPVPVTTEGAPPPIDVYIDDGRNGEYPYEEVFWENQDIWNRQAADGGTTHESPIVNQPNFVYVRVKNRGTDAAENVLVRCYHCKPSTGLAWPNDWQATTTPELPAPAPIAAAGGQVVVGPFEWTPTQIGHECLLATATAPGDLSNIDPASGLPCATGPTPHWRLVPYDNNIGQRNVAPVAGSFYGLIESFKNRRFWVNNPFEKRARIQLNVELPPFLAHRGWTVELPRKGVLLLEGHASRRVRITLRPGKPFKPSDVKGHRMIRIKATVQGHVVGGLSYLVDPKLEASPAERH